MSRRQRRAAIATLWTVMVERAEAVNDLVVSGQRDASLAAAQEIARHADMLRTLVRAVLILADEADDAA
jgi:hypothetical protein